MRRLFSALIGVAALPLFAVAALAEVDLSDTDCPSCSPKLLREPEPKPTERPTTEAKETPDPVAKGQERGQRELEDFAETKARQDAEKNKEK